MDRLLDNTEVSRDQASLFLARFTSWTTKQNSWSHSRTANNASAEFVVRCFVGEGIEKASNDFESEVAVTMAVALNN